MKKHTILFLALCLGCICSLSAQSMNKKAFIGFSGGVSIPLKNSENIDRNTGFNVNFIEFDYLLKKNSGITFSGFYTQNKIPDSDEKMFSAGMLFGAIGHYSIANHLSIDIMPMGGVGMASAYVQKHELKYTSSSQWNQNSHSYIETTGTFTSQFAAAIALKFRIRCDISNAVSIALIPEYLGTINIEADENASTFHNWSQNLNIRVGLLFNL
ncbi:hypothetical protein LJC16_02730 [Bacteroidales bacterium OttesenSCG-928-C19]|nr:hypothetical protein [Bacteroidales bacterium OttesenSCG-928-C19]